MILYHMNSNSQGWLGYAMQYGVDFLLLKIFSNQVVHSGKEILHSLLNSLSTVKKNPSGHSYSAGKDRMKHLLLKNAKLRLVKDW